MTLYSERRSEFKAFLRTTPVALGLTRSWTWRAQWPAWRCPGSVTIRGEDDDELVGNASAHIDRHHPDLVGKVSRDDLLAMAEEA